MFFYIQVFSSFSYISLFLTFSLTCRRKYLLADLSSYIFQQPNFCSNCFVLFFFSNSRNVFPDLLEQHWHYSAFFLCIELFQFNSSLLFVDVRRGVWYILTLFWCLVVVLITWILVVVHGQIYLAILDKFYNKTSYGYFSYSKDIFHNIRHNFWILVSSLFW